MLFNDPKTFREDMLKGYVSAYRNYIVEVPGGVARATETPKDKVAVINGGGSGHFPAFCGIVGEGFMDGTVVGNIFSSPSTEDVLGVAKSVLGNRGILIVGGNYQGDKMNFNLARDKMIEEGIDAKTFYITDDIASAKPEEIEKRRGNVGTFTVFKAAGAAAAAGLPIWEVERLTSKMNDATRTMSVGFKGCTMPGASEPMFRVPEGKMEVGQGIHGEPGVYESDLVSAEKLAEMLLDHILEDAGALTLRKRIAVILDGLGSTKYEELFVVWKTVSGILEEKGFTLVDPLVGELVTSLDMAGLAISISFLDEELEPLWTAPADTPAFRKGVITGSANAEKRVGKGPEADAADESADKVKAEEKPDYGKASGASKKAAAYAVKAFRAMKEKISEEEETLARIDAVAGDGDHGRGMVKGVTYALEAAEEAQNEGAGLGSVLIAAGKAWAAKAGGTSGVLWGEALMEAGRILGDTDFNYSPEEAANAVSAACARMQALGGAKPGDKTMLDVLIPFSEALTEKAAEGLPLRKAWKYGAEIASQAAEATQALLPKIGRARPQAERSLGTPDAGAVSMAMCIRAVLL